MTQGERTPAVGLEDVASAGRAPRLSRGSWIDFPGQILEDHVHDMGERDVIVRVLGDPR